MHAAAAVRAWIDGWTRGWRDHDPDKIGAIYADGATFVSAPFREPQPPAEYVAWAFADEEAVEFWFGEPVVGESAAAIPYWAIVRNGENEETLAGIAHVRFAADGRVREQRDYWTMEPGARRPPDGWGPVVAHSRRGE